MNKQRVLTHLFDAVLCEQPTQEDYAGGLVKHQMVMEFDMHTWKVGHLLGSNAWNLHD